MSDILSIDDYRNTYPRESKEAHPIPARVVFDFSYSIYGATLRRRRFQEIMSDIDDFGSQIPPITNRDELNTLFIYRMSEELKEKRYRLNFDVLNALRYIGYLISTHLDEVSPGVFAVPRIADLTERNLPFEDFSLLVYIFSEEHSGNPELEELKKEMRQYFLNRADATWDTHKRSGEDIEMMYRELSEILVLVLDVAKTYTFPFHMGEKLGTSHAANN